MSTPPLQHPKEDAISLVQREIARAEDDRKPISRQMLADIVQEQLGLPHADAFSIVDRYCEDNAPAVPGYLQEEFAIPYLKVIAIINVIVGLGIFWMGVLKWKQSNPIWPYLTVGTIFCGLGVFAWVQSLERYAERRKKRT
jgi:hypothetical protein